MATKKPANRREAREQPTLIENIIVEFIDYMFFEPYFWVMNALGKQKSAQPAKTKEINLELIRIGQIIDGRYQLLEKLREQQFYVVYSARLVNTDTRAIVKLIRPEYVMPGETFERLRPNLAVVASLRHSGIAHLREFGEDRTIYLAEEYYEGTLLNTILESGSNLNTLQTLELCIRILEALSHAHAKGNVHGLLSPESVVVLGNLSVKISDFYSLAAITAPLGLSSDRPGRDTRYGSPESLAGLAVTFQSDIYSAGVIIYQLMTARLPFTGKQALENAIRTKTPMPWSTAPPPPQEINPAVSPLLSSVILKAIKPQTSARYTTASEFLSELHLCRSSLMRSMSEQQFMAGNAAAAAVVPPTMTPASAAPPRQPEPVYVRPQQPAPPPPQRTEPPIRQPVDARRAVNIFPKQESVQSTKTQEINSKLKEVLSLEQRIKAAMNFQDEEANGKIIPWEQFVIEGQQTLMWLAEGQSLADIDYVRLREHDSIFLLPMINAYADEMKKRGVVIGPIGDNCNSWRTIKENYNLSESRLPSDNSLCFLCRTPYNQEYMTVLYANLQNKEMPFARFIRLNDKNLNSVENGCFDLNTLYKLSLRNHALDKWYLSSFENAADKSVQLALYSVMTGKKINSIIVNNMDSEFSLWIFIYRNIEIKNYQMANYFLKLSSEIYKESKPIANLLTTLISAELNNTNSNETEYKNILSEVMEIAILSPSEYSPFILKIVSFLSSPHR